MPSQPCGLHRRHSRIESVDPILAHLPKRDRFILAGNNWGFAFSQIKPAKINLSLIGRSLQWMGLRMTEGTS